MSSTKNISFLKTNNGSAEQNATGIPKMTIAQQFKIKVSKSSKSNEVSKTAEQLDQGLNKNSQVKTLEPTKKKVRLSKESNGNLQVESPELKKKRSSTELVNKLQVETPGPEKKKLRLSDESKQMSSDRYNELKLQFDELTRENNKLKSELVKSQEMCDDHEEAKLNAEKELTLVKKQLENANVQLLQFTTENKQLTKDLAWSQSLCEKLKSGEKVATLERDLATKVKELNTERRKTDKLIKKHSEMSTQFQMIGKVLEKQAKSNQNDGRRANSIELWLYAIAVEMDGRNSASQLGLLWSNVSACYWNLKEYEKSLLAANKAIGYEPENAARFYNRAKIHVSLEHTPEASQDLAKALKLNPNHENAKKMLSKLTR